jgi:uncharacterized protein
MESKLLVLSRFFAATPFFVVRHRVIVLTLLASISAFAIFSMSTRTSMDMSIDSFLDQTDPAITALNAYRSQFGSDDSVFLVYEARDGDVFSQASLQAVRQLTDNLRQWQDLDPANYDADLQELSQIRRVQSITTLRVQRVDGDTLLSERLVPEIIPSDLSQLQQIRERALAEDDYRLAFYSDDGRFGALMLQTTFGAQPEESYIPAVNADNVALGDFFTDFADDASSFDLHFDESAQIDEIPFQAVDMLEYHGFYAAVRAVYADVEDRLTFYSAGNPPLMSWVYEVLQQMIWIGLGMIGIFVYLLRSLFHSFSAVVWSIVTIALSLIWTWGFTVWFGITLSTMLTLTVMLIFAVGIADCVHVMSAYFVKRKQGNDHPTALSHAYAKPAWPSW